MDQFLNNIWTENNYPAKVKLLKLAKEAKPEVKKVISSNYVLMG